MSEVFRRADIYIPQEAFPTAEQRTLCLRVLSRMTDNQDTTSAPLVEVSKSILHTGHTSTVEPLTLSSTKSPSE